HELLAAELDARRRRGERPTATEYADRCPEHAQQIRELFPAVERSEGLDTSGTDRSDRTEASAEPAADGDRPQALHDYRIEREPGRGGMGVVYRAFDQRRGEVVALKTVRRPDAAAILRFKREFRALADLSHPNLVTLHELTADGS